MFISLLFYNFEAATTNAISYMNIEKTQNPVEVKVTIESTAKDGGKRHIATAEVSIEVTGKDTPTEYDRRRRRWRVAAAWSILAFVTSLAGCIIAGLTVFTASAAAVCFVAAFVCICNAGNIYPEEVKYCNYRRYWGV